ncbi:hypothetical protein BDN70DRAFT_933391 [Pholiota conissans]|uniref:Uncharacterized protein n=1 Tax=Pholiota conissans TaxID=109636 RepID=A0A9P5Z1K3_9AGAR|nr:hypothetical protein BDN70DRAFT_933391 [Pholiota conissans]
MSSRSAYTGTQRKLVLAFDVGTTFSGISYSILEPGQVPEIKSVTRFPAHEQISGASKIPTIIYYDRSGNVKAVGADAMVEGIYEQAVDEQWVKAEWFKLHLRSWIGPGIEKEVKAKIPPLPLNKTVVAVISDFLAYLFKCAASYIQDAEPDTASLFANDQIDFVLCHPNVCGDIQQSQMREAAVLAGLIPYNASRHLRLSFVKEGEASLHFAIQHGLQFEKGEGVAIVDAGGGTIDISSYSENISLQKQGFEEMAIPQCHFQGSGLVTIYAQRFLSNYLADSPFIGDVDHIAQCFDKTTKLTFKNTDIPQYIKFGPRSTRDKDVVHNIRFGQIKLFGADIAQFFEPSVISIVNAILDQKRSARKPVSHVVLVGGFACSDYLLSQIQDELRTFDVNIHRPDAHIDKAVSDGAISFYLDHIMRTRISKVTYGTFRAIPYDPCNSDHLHRRMEAYVSPSGIMLIDGFFSIILPKNTQISETQEFRREYSTDYDSSINLETHRLEEKVICYQGNIEDPKWKEIETSEELCNIMHYQGQACKITGAEVTEVGWIGDIL